MTATAVEVRHAARLVKATKVYGSGDTTVRALDDISVAVPEGRFTAVMGPSGSGKSTLLHCMAGLDSLTSGQVFIGDVELGSLGDTELTLLRRRSVGFVFQAFNLLPTLTAAENITLPLSLAGAKADKDWLDQVIETVGLGDRLRHRPAELSGGQAQRVAIARALVTRPQVIFADEPTGNLDSQAGSEILGFLARAARELGQTIVMVTHDPNAAAYADAATFLADGHVVDRLDQPTAETVLRASPASESEPTMFVVTAKSLWSHKRRLAGTVFAIFLGVAFLTGTLALSDTLRANFTTLFTSANAGTDAVVRSATTIGGRGLDRPTLIPASLLDRVRTVSGVADAQPVIAGYGQLVGADGTAVGGNGPPRQAGNWITDPALNPYRLVQGRAPQADDEVVINRGAATAGKLHVGDTTVVQVPEPVQVRIVGVATFGTADGFGQATYTAFSLHGAQAHILNNAAQLSSIAVRAQPGVTQDQLTATISRALPAGVEAISGAQLTAKNISDIATGFLAALRTFLTVFAAIALLVATFSINNTLSILVAQRGRESALLRAVGATRRQILAAVVVESLVVATVASVAGVAGGIGVAGMLKGLFDIVGFSLPAGGLVLRPTTLIVAMIVGIVVTAVAGLVPAIRASRVAPIAALREVATEPVRPSVLRVAAGVALGALGIAVVVSAVTGSGSGVLARAGVGALATMIAVVILGPAVAAPITAALAAPLVRWRGYTGALARQNAVRNPRRTSATAAALMVGVSVVTLFTVFAASLKGSVTTGVTRSVRADLVIATGSFGGGGLSPQLARDVAALPQVVEVAGLGDGNALISGSPEKVSIIDPAKAAALINIDPVHGSLSALRAQQLAVSKKTADAKGWKIGTTLPVVFPDSATQDMTVALVYNSRDLAGDYLLPQAIWVAHAAQSVDTAIFIAVRPGIPMSVAKAAVTRVAAAYGNPTVDTRQAYAKAAGDRVNIILGLVYVMLALAIIVALLGIANTLALSTFERTRELGLLRAVGQTRGQLRAMVRWESVTIAVFGTVGGLAVGLFLGWALVTAANTAGTLTGFAAPAGQLVTILGVGGLAGVVAGVRPARRAARINVLTAVAAR